MHSSGLLEIQKVPIPQSMALYVFMPVLQSFSSKEGTLTGHTLEEIGAPLLGIFTWEVLTSANKAMLK